MDTRLLSDQENGVIREFDVDNLQDKFLIPYDKVTEDKRFMESIVYNLVQKLDTMDFLQNKFQVKLSQEVKTNPEWIKYYVHVPYLIPVVTIGLTYMKFKRKLSINSFFVVICTSCLINEFSRYRKVKSMSKEHGDAYMEYTTNYQFLMQEFIQNNPKKNVFRYLLGYDLDEFSKKGAQINQQGRQNDDESFIFDQY